MNYDFKQTEIGNIPKDWEFDSLKNNLIIKGRIGWKGLKRSEYLSKGYAIINGEQIINDKIDWTHVGRITKERYDESPEIMLQKNDILMTKDGTIGKLAYVDKLNEPATVASGVFVIRNNSKNIDPRYLFYIFKSNYFRSLIKSRIEGSVIPHLYQRDIVELKIPIPPIYEQHHIAKILSDFDLKIELNNQTNTKLETLAQVLFKRWFVDFEFPNEKEMPYKSSGGKLINSELGKIPEKWRIGKMIDIVENLDSKRVPLSNREREQRKGSYPYYGATSIMDYINDYLFDGIYLLLGEDGTVIDENGRPILQYVWGKFWVNNHAHVLKGKSNFSTEYIYLLMKNTNIRNIITGAVQLKINQGNLNNIKIIIPDKETLKLFNKISDNIFNQYRLNKNEITSLKQIQNSLLPRFMSGKIRVNGVSK